MNALLALIGWRLVRAHRMRPTGMFGGGQYCTRCKVSTPSTALNEPCRGRWWK